MTSLLGRTLEIIALPRKVYGNADLSDWNDLLAMSETVGLDHAPHSLLTIEQRSGDYLRKVVSNIDVESETSTVLVFKITLDRQLIATYVGRSREIVKRRSLKQALNDATVAKVYRSTKSVIFNGELFRDFGLKAYTILMASHIANPFGLSVNRVVSVSASGGATSERFRINLFRNASADDVELRKLSTKSMYDFLWARPMEMAREPKSQFMKGASYVSQIFRNSENPLVVFMWSLAAIEAMLSISSDNANSKIMELRLRALLDGEKTDHIVGKFREAYRYRNAVFHGNVALPYSFDGRNIFGFRSVKHSETYPFETASFTHSLALRILQRFFELSMYDISYNISVDR